MSTPTRPADWLCASCGAGIWANGSPCVVIHTSWLPSEPEHLCGECWGMIMLSAKVALEAAAVTP